MRIKTQPISTGLNPDQAVVEVSTSDGPQTLVVDKRSITNDTIDVGQPLGEHDKFILVELPTETDSGNSRVWVDKAIGEPQ
jgi:hypothetical protein